MVRATGRVVRDETAPAQFDTAIAALRTAAVMGTPGPSGLYRIGTALSDVYHPDDHVALEKYLSRLGGVETALPSDEMRIVKGDGTTAWVRFAGLATGILPKRGPWILEVTSDDGLWRGRAPAENPGRAVAISYGVTPGAARLNPDASPQEGEAGDVKAHAL